MFEYIFLTGCTVGINWRQCIYDLIFFNLIFCQFNAWSNVINLTSVYYSLTFSIYMKNLMNCENNNKQHIFFSLWNFYNHFIPIYTNKGTSSTPVLLINDDLCHNLFLVFIKFCYLIIFGRELCFLQYKTWTFEITFHFLTLNMSTCYFFSAHTFLFW